MSTQIPPFKWESLSLHLEACETPWDTKVFGFPVASIDRIQVHNEEQARQELLQFNAWAQQHQFGLISCRLPSEQLKEAFLLQDIGYRYIETVLHPVCRNLARFHAHADPTILISTANEDDLVAIQRIASHAFVNERHYVDYRLDPSVSGQRYANWAKSALHHPRQQLLKITCDARIIAFFIIEQDSLHNVYWHLTAIDPALHGKGYGDRVWRAMLARHHVDGILSVSTTIAARNIAVLNLYASLNFRFSEPDMSYHWVNAAITEMSQA